jgi:hypothetical protein
VDVHAPESSVTACAHIRRCAVCLTIWGIIGGGWGPGGWCGENHLNIVTFWAGRRQVWRWSCCGSLQHEALSP